MGSRGQKRTESVDDLPADKRACSSLEFKPSSSNSLVQNPISLLHTANSTSEAREGDMDTSSCSASSRSESDDGDKDSAYGSCDSDGERRSNNIMREYQRGRASVDHGKFKRVLSSLSQRGDQSGTLAALTELCELLAFCPEGSLSNLVVDSFSPILINLAKNEINPDTILLSLRAITYLCDVHSRSPIFLVGHGAVPTLCQRLRAIEYLDVAEQCLQALEKISREQPYACLLEGAIMAVLTYIDFFSTSVQKVALSTVVNICKKLPAEGHPLVMEAVPALCNLLQYEDRQLVEDAITCLIKITEKAQNSVDVLNELCDHGVIAQATHLIGLKCRTTLSTPIYSGLIGLFVKLASGSTRAVQTLFELDISGMVKDIFSTYDLSHAIAPSQVKDGYCGQVHEVLRLLHVLLPALGRNQNVQINLDKQAFFSERPDLFQKFGKDLLPVLIQVVNSGANLSVCCGSLHVINKFVYFSKPEMLLELSRDTNISSFLAGVLSRKDQHVLIVALQVVDILLQKKPDIFLSPFVKEGITFAIDALLTPEKRSKSSLRRCSSSQLPNDSSQKIATRNALGCMCYAFHPPPASESGTCEIDETSIPNLAEHIMKKYFAALLNHDKGTDILHDLRSLASSLNDMNILSMDKDTPYSQHEHMIHMILCQIMGKVSGREPISTFEFIESGIVNSLVNYLSHVEVRDRCSQINYMERRFEAFGSLFLPSEEKEEFPLSVLVEKLQTALSSVESFPIFLNHGMKLRNSYANIPYGRCTSYPCLKVQFIKGEGETGLSDYSESVHAVDPFVSLAAIELYLWPRVRLHINREVKDKDERGCTLSQYLQDMHSEGNDVYDLHLNTVLSNLQRFQEDNTTLSCKFISRNNPGVIKGCSETSNNSVGNKQSNPSTSSEGHTNSNTGCFSNEHTTPKLLYYLEGEELDRKLTLYQAILRQKVKEEHEIGGSAKLWNQVYKITYKRECRQGSSNGHYQIVVDKLKNKDRMCWQQASFFSSVLSRLVSDLENPHVHDILVVLKTLEGINRSQFQILSQKNIHAYAQGRIDNLDNLRAVVSAIPQNEFVNTKLTEKLEQHMRDPIAISVGSLPSWCVQLMGSCPFLFGSDARCKYFRLAAFGQLLSQPQSSSSHFDSRGLIARGQNSGVVPRKKFLVCRNFILESATKMMDLHARQKVVLEVEYDEEVGTGLGPTLEFYTLVSHEFQKWGLGIWRDDYITKLEEGDSRILISSCGLFPRPWSSRTNSINGVEFSGVLKKFTLLGQVVAKALHDGRVLDIPFSKAFYKLILGQELTIYDIHLFDPELGRTLLEFQSIVERQKYLKSITGEDSVVGVVLCFRDTSIVDLCLDFTLPGYPEHYLSSASDPQLVNESNLEEYVNLIVDATIGDGISKQIEAFKTGFNQVFHMSHLQVLSEEELEHLLCGERGQWTENELLDHMKFDHGYTASSPPIINLLEVIQEFDHEERRAFLQFVTGAPRLPPGGLASLNPKLTIVCKNSGGCTDSDLPSVMTCANYLKLPPYSSKETLRVKLLYAITEGQGSFHLS
ncbi:E3 ubiquitin-protein ligase UPL4 [Impatiens glandulifera]|uniref:E3 ubiquitin-protein ligase UPL4 n=1 Tax=Impatiens glandulifera TaxID=253017 RepID=UPI001FB19813|nr:E3 ubiquitin-protein ligase UPL4 [Impatiens glandulifera]